MQIEGRVVAEGHRGVSGLIVHATSQEGSEPPRRLGSVVTDATGGFAFEADDLLAAKEPALRLTVTAPTDASGVERVLVVTAARSNPGRRETFLIQLDGKTLAGAGVAVPSGLPQGLAEPGDVVFRAARVAERRAQIARGVAAAAAPQVAAALDRVLDRRRTVEELLYRDLGVTGRADGGLVVQPGQRLRAVLQARLRTRITTHQALRRRASLPIGADQLERLRLDPGGDRLDSIAVEQALRLAPTDGDSAAPVGSARIDLLASLCRRGEVDGPEPGPPAPAPPPATAPPALLTMADALDRLTDAAGRGAAGVGIRGTAASVGSTIGRLELRGGPADVAAVHDFTVLAVALDDVWKQIVDPDLVEVATEVCDELEQAGVELSTVLSRAPSLAHGLRHAAHAVLAAGVMPDEVVDADERDRPDLDVAHRHRRIRARELEPARRVRDADAAKTRTYEDGSGRRIVGAELLQDLVNELMTRLAEPHTFQVFATEGDDRAVNFGLAITYRQRWEPLTYQAGPLVRTLTLAPGEERTFNVKRSVKRSEAAVRGLQSEAADRSEIAETVRDVSDVVNAAKTSLGFQAEGRFDADFKLGSAGGSTTISRDAERSSQETRQSFREAVRKAAQEQKEARKVEVTTTDAIEDSREETGKITNPNVELPVTYLFYELERRFRVSEQLYRAVPVVLVAQDVPVPDQITRAWLVEHDWILARVLRDESFRPALRYLVEEAPGAEIRLGQLRENLTTQRALVAELKEQIRTLQADAESHYAALLRQIQARADIIAGNDAESIGRKALEFMSGGDQSPEAAQVREDMARDAYERAVKLERDARDRMAGAATALDAATRVYVEANARFENAELGVLRLRVHVKQNILFYLQAIWDHEPRDQRVFRLQGTPVPRLAGSLQYRLVPDPDAVAVPPLWTPPYRVEATMEIDDVDATVPLADIADLDRPLGYRGNYMMFAMRQHNTLTKFLSVPYADSRAQVRDPDELGNFSISQLDGYAACLRSHLTTEEFDAIRPQLTALYAAILARPYPDEEEIILPSHSLFIEAIPGAAPVLEDFQLQHRAIDTARVAAEARLKELESLRLVARLRAGELGDPDVQTMIVAPTGTPIVVGGGGGGGSS